MDLEKQSSKSTANSLANSCDELIKSKPFIPIRFLIVALCWFCAMILFFTRLNLSVAIVAMVNHTAIHSRHNKSDDFALVIS